MSIRGLALSPRHWYLAGFSRQPQMSWWTYFELHGWILSPTIMTGFHLALAHSGSIQSLGRIGIILGAICAWILYQSQATYRYKKHWSWESGICLGIISILLQTWHEKWSHNTPRARSPQREEYCLTPHCSWSLQSWPHGNQASYDYFQLPLDCSVHCLSEGSA